MSGTGEFVAPKCANLQQGNVIALPELMLPGIQNGTSQKLITAGGVAIISQTCDVVQASKKRCLVAPILENPTEQVISNALKGKSPLHLYLIGSDGQAHIANLEVCVAVPKAQLEGLQILSRVNGGASSQLARQISAKIMRAFGRFAFPDALHPVLNKFKDKAQKASVKTGAFSQVLELIHDIRISADQWDHPGREMTLYLVVPEELLRPLEDLDSNWQWDSADVRGRRKGESLNQMDLNRVSELIVENRHSDPRVLESLWRQFSSVIEDIFSRVENQEEVSSFEVVAISDTEMSVRQYKQTESFDLEVLSHSKL